LSFPTLVSLSSPHTSLDDIIRFTKTAFKPCLHLMNSGLPWGECVGFCTFLDEISMSFSWFQMFYGPPLLHVAERMFVPHEWENESQLIGFTPHFNVLRRWLKNGRLMESWESKLERKIFVRFGSRMTENVKGVIE
jgi:hypothetical protein